MRRLRSGYRQALAILPWDPPNPRRPCPGLQVPPEVARLVDGRRVEQDAEIQRIVAAGQPAVGLVLSDGGMHSSFREILRRSGPERLRSLSSARADVSRAEAVMRDPIETPIGATARQ